MESLLNALPSSLTQLPLAPAAAIGTIVALLGVRSLNSLLTEWSYSRRLRKLAAERKLDPSKIISCTKLNTFPWNFLGIRIVFESLKHVNRYYDYLGDWVEKLGKVYVLDMIGRDTFIVDCDPDDIEYILKTNFQNYSKGHLFVDIMDDFLGNGIFNSDGSLWKQQRATASHIFTVRELRTMADVFVRHGKTVVDILMSTKGEIDIQELFQRYTLDSFGEIAFGVDIGSLKSSDVPFAVAFDAINSLSFLRFLDPFWKLKRALPFLSENEVKLKKAIKVSDNFVYDLIKNRKEEKSEDREDLVSLFLRLFKKEAQDKNMDKQLRDFVMNFVIAGRDTTAALLTMTFYLLAKNPDKLKILLEEIDSTLQGNAPDYEGVKNMKYLKAVFDETMRLYPPVPLNGRDPIEDDILPSGVFLPAGVRVGYSVYVVGRMSEYWDNPLEFRPERFLEKLPKPNAYMPFHYGPRLCLGQNMALMEAKILVCMILQKMVLVGGPEKIVTIPSATWRVQPMKLRPELRKF